MIRKTTPAALAAVALLALSACGGTTSSVEEGKDGVKMGNGVTDTEIRVGHFSDYSGPIAEGATSGSLGGELAFDAINEAGGKYAGLDRYKALISIMDGLTDSRQTEVVVLDDWWGDVNDGQLEMCPRRPSMIGLGPRSSGPLGVDLLSRVLVIHLPRCVSGLPTEP